MPGIHLFRRTASVRIGDLSLPNGFRMEFKVKKTLKGHPNTLDLTISNLSAQTRAAMQTKGAKVMLLAGYEENPDQLLFNGDARSIDHVRRGPTWLTRVQCGDGEAAMQSRTVSLSFGPGAKVGDVLLRLAQDAGLDLGNVSSRLKAGDVKGAATQFLNGFAASGRAFPELQNVARAAGLDVSVQDGALQALGRGESTKEEAVLLSAETGLVDSPEHGTPERSGEQAVLKVKSLLQPGIRPGRRIQLDAQFIKGSFVTETVTHSGDTHGAAWYSEVECRPLGTVL